MFFETLGISAIIGRVLIPEDDRIPDSPPVCVLSYGLWQQRFGADRNVIGRKIQIGGRPFTIIGVTSKGFSGFVQGTQTELFMPRKAAGMSQFANLPRTFGRLKPGVSIEQAQASLDVLYHQFETRGLRRGGVKIILEPGNRGFVSVDQPVRTATPDVDGCGRVRVTDRMRKYHQHEQDSMLHSVSFSVVRRVA